MKPFKDTTSQGNEPAIRRGRVVPKGAVNLAFAKSPSLTPENNVVIVDTSRIVAENSLDSGGRKKLYYADALGVLQDINGNQLIEDEYPVISDVFTIDENWSIVEDDEYTDESILPFRHVSRYFHIDFVGLCPPGDLPVRYKGNHIKVVDAKGRTHAREDGSPAFQIMVTPARASLGLTSQQHPYRVYAYVDTDTNEDLYLAYNKVEISTNASIKNQELDYKELLNPLAYFDYRPEESEVVDPVNRDKLWYSTKPVNLKKQLLNESLSNVDGYQVFVPRKAMGDPRIFQLFRWRVSCEFSQTLALDNIRKPTIQCGVVITNSDLSSRTPYAFYNLQLSNYNATSADESANIKFQNPGKTNHSVTEQQTAAYWYVNIDTTSVAELKKYDILIWSPSGAEFDFGPYSDFIWTFTQSFNSTLFVDTNNATYPHNLFGGIKTSAAVDPTSVTKRTVGGFSGMQLYSNPSTATGSEYFNGAAGGWILDGDVGDSENAALTHLQTVADTPWTQYGQSILALPSGFMSLVGFSKPGTIYTYVDTPGYPGRFVFSTLGHLFSCSALFSHLDRVLINENTGSVAFTDSNYLRYVNSTNIEGAMKFFFNVCLTAVKRRALTDEDNYEVTPSTWSFTSPWYSSWAINASNDVLSSNEKAKFNFRYEQVSPGSTQSVWKRRLTTPEGLRTMKEIIDDAMTPSMVKQMEGSVREYVMELTNSRVSFPTTDVGDGTYPDAWTTAWTPQFRVPHELGPHVIREEEVQGDPDTGLFTHHMYPDKPYAGRVRETFSTTTEANTGQTFTWTATGTATETFQVITKLPDTIIPEVVIPATTTPDTTTTVTSEITLSWWNHFAEPFYYVNTSNPANGVTWPRGISTWQDHNYYDATSQWGNGLLNWPFMGLTGRYQQGSSGDAVRFIQDALNRFQDRGFYSYGHLTVDGYFGGSTESAVKAFQSQRGARFIDGIVDAETWSLFSYQLRRGGWRDTAPGFYQLYNLHWHHLDKAGISDVNSSSEWSKRSWVSGGPNQIWELFQIEFAQEYNIHGVTLWPQVYGDWPHIMWQSIDVRPPGFTMKDYNSRSGFMTYMGLNPHRDYGQRVDFAPRRGAVVIIGVGQDHSAGGPFGTARSLGVKDIHAHAEVSNTIFVPGNYTPEQVTPGYLIPGETIITQQTRVIPISNTGTSTVYTQSDLYVQAIPNYSGDGSISGISWNSLTVSNPEVVSLILSNGVMRFRNLISNTNAVAGASLGRDFPGTTIYYSTDEKRSTARLKVEAGYVNKTEGIKILCDASRNPIGFPVLPADVPGDGIERHYTTLRLETFGNDSAVVMGFYDVAAQEFVVNAGRPEMSYGEYTARGISNVYLAVVSTYEVNQIMPITSDDEANFLPYRYAMPVYGVQKRLGTKITLEPLAKNLGPDDIWPVAVRPGKFLRNVAIRPVAAGRLTGYLDKYQDTEVRAYYSIPEAGYGGWSTLYGPPNVDIKNETPMILDDNVLQVRQAPILLVRQPTTRPSEADPMRLALKLYKRRSHIQPWELQPPSEVKDYNSSTGELFLKTPLTINDPGLLKIDYTSARGNYYFKKSGSTFLNLNPYSGHTRGLIGSAITIYIVPEYVKDDAGKIIQLSVQTRTLRFATSQDIFDPIRPEYDPLAIQLGTIYVSTAIDSSDVVLLDTRRRGGGAQDSAAVEEIVNKVRESSTYWDINYGAGVSYQKGGFVVIRLPKVLQNDFNEAEIVEVIERNVAAGVRFKIEDLNGNNWT